MPRSKTVCSCLESDELSKDCRRRWPKLAVDGEVEEVEGEGMPSDRAGEDAEEVFLDLFFGIGIAADIFVFACKIVHNRSLMWKYTMLKTKDFMNKNRDFGCSCKRPERSMKDILVHAYALFVLSCSSADD